MDILVRRTLIPFVCLSLALAVVGGCSSPSNGGGARLDLSGTWVVTGPSAAFDVDGPRTFTFLGRSGGEMRFRAESLASGVLSCRSYLFALVDDTVLLLESYWYESEAFLVAVAGADRLTLTSDRSELTLERVAGAGPVADCRATETEVVAELAGRPSHWSRLQPVGSTLYYNLDVAQDPIVGYDLVTRSLGPERTYTVSFGGGVDRFAMAAFDHQVFYGHCACGGSDSFSRFNLTTNTRLDTVDTQTDLGVRVSIRFGAFDAWTGSLWIGGSPLVGAYGMLVFELDPINLTLLSQRELLPGHTITDLTFVDGRMFALLGYESTIVEVGPDGRAVGTWSLARAANREFQGLAAAAGGMHLLLRDGLRDLSVLVTVGLR